MRVSRLGKNVNGYFVVMTTVLSSAFLERNIDHVDGSADDRRGQSASYCGDLSS